MRWVRPTSSRPCRGSSATRRRSRGTATRSSAGCPVTRSSPCRPPLPAPRSSGSTPRPGRRRVAGSRWRSSARRPCSSRGDTRGSRPAGTVHAGGCPGLPAGRGGSRRARAHPRAHARDAGPPSPGAALRRASHRSADRPRGAGHDLRGAAARGRSRAGSGIHPARLRARGRLVPGRGGAGPGLGSDAPRELAVRAAIAPR